MSTNQPRGTGRPRGRPTKLFKDTLISGKWDSLEDGDTRPRPIYRDPAADPDGRSLWHPQNEIPTYRPSKEGGRVQTSPSIGTLTVSQQQAVFLWKSCYLHIAYLLASSVATGETQNQGSSLDCKICGRWLDNGMQVAEYDFAYRTSKDISARKFRLKSESEAAAFEALESVIYRSTIEGPYHLLRVAADDKVRFVEGCHLLKGHVSSPDIWILDLRLLIFVDGESHFKDTYKTTLEYQNAVDNRTNQQAKEQGFHVLRLSYEDKDEYVVEINGAGMDIQNQRERERETGITEDPLLLYSPSYIRPAAESEHKCV